MGKKGIFNQGRVSSIYIHGAIKIKGGDMLLAGKSAYGTGGRRGSGLIWKGRS